MSVILLLVVVTLLAGCRLFGGGGIGGVGSGGIVKGEITNIETGEKITDTAVTVSAGGRSVETSTGTYELKNVPTGMKTLKAVAAGYESFEQQVRVTAGVLTVPIEMQPDETEITGRVMAPAASIASTAVPDAPNMWNQLAAFLSGPIAHAQSIAGETPVAGADVQAYNWHRGTPVGNSTTTDQDGYYTLTGIPEGIDIVVKVTKGSLRLASAVPSVVSGDTVDVNTVSTLTAEALAQDYGLDLPIDPIIMDEVQARVFTEVQGDQTIDLRPGQGWLGDEFGGMNLNPVLIALREDLIPALDGVVRAKRIIQTLRNLGPSLVAYGGPVVSDATDAINEKIGPLFAGVVDRVSIIGTLIENADLEPLEIDEEFSFYDGEDESDSNHVLNVTITNVEDLGSGEKKVWTEFTIDELDPVSEIGSGTMIFEISDDRPVSWMDLETSLYETIDGEELALTLNAEIEFEWFDVLTGDIRDLKRITILAGPDSGEVIDSTLMTANGTLRAELDDREWVDWKQRRVIMPLSLQFDGSIDIIDVATVAGDLEFELTPGSEEYTLDAYLSIDIDRQDEFHISGRFGAAGVFVAEEDETTFGATSASFSGMVEVPSRPGVELSLQTERVGMSRLDFTELQFTRGDVLLSGDGVLTVHPGDELGKFLGGNLVLSLEDDERYSIVLNVVIDADDNLDITGDMKDASGTLLAEIVTAGYSTPMVVYYDASGELRTESLL